MAKNPGICRFGDCRAIGQLRLLSGIPDESTAAARSQGLQPRERTIEICGRHWPEVRAKAADRAHWRAVTRDEALSFEGVPARV
jgi:hypothetical protein